MKRVLLALALTTAAQPALAFGFHQDEASSEAVDSSEEQLTEWIHEAVADSELSDEHKELVEAQILSMIASTRAGDIDSAWQTARELNDLKNEIRASEGKAVDRGFFGLIGGGWDLIQAVKAKDNVAIGKAVLKILWNLVF